MSNVETLYVVGEAVLHPDLAKRDRTFRFPTGQKNAILTTIQAESEPEDILWAMAIEYGTLLITLESMGLPFVVLRDERHTESELLAGIIEERQYGRMIVGERNFYRGQSYYPRDALQLLPEQRALLFSSSSVSHVDPKQGDLRLLISPYGQGGRSLVSGDILVASSEIATNTVSDVCARPLATGNRRTRGKDHRLPTTCLP